MEESFNKTPEITATIKAIENGALILETTDYQQLIRWPIDRLPNSLNIGNTISIKMDSNNIETHNPLPIPHHNNGEEQNNHRQKLLEELIN